MSVLALNPNVRVDPPARLPVDYLSLSSLKKFQMCPEKWRRHYIDHEPEPSSGKMVLGSSAGAALAQHYGRQIETGEGISGEELLDEFCAEWEDRIGREEVDYGSDTPGELKDSGARALGLYHSGTAPGIVPVSVEREFELSWPGVEWRMAGFLDLETAAGRVGDYKLGSKRMSDGDVRADLQPTTYLVARRAEGNPAAGFDFHVMARTKTPTVTIMPAPRSEAQLDLFTDRVFALAVEIDWRCQTGSWMGAPPMTWFCGNCRYANCKWRLG
jgi:hypothetical protein